MKNQHLQLDEVSMLWRRLEAWLAAHAPQCLAELNGPATDLELDCLATELSLPFSLPERILPDFLKYVQFE